MVRLGSIVKSDVIGALLYQQDQAVRAARRRGVVSSEYYDWLEKSCTEEIKKIEKQFAEIDGGFEWEITTLESTDGEKRRVAYRQNQDYDPLDPKHPKYFMRDEIDGVTLDLLTEHLESRQRY